MQTRNTAHRSFPFLRIGILLSTGYAFAMLLHWPIGFTFFTQLSNLFTALVVLCQLLMPRQAERLKLWKYMAAVSIFLTFLVYLLVLAPIMPGGILAAYRQDHWASLCMHVITPFLTLADFFLYDTDYPWRVRHVFLAALPPFAWLVFILVLGQLGLRWGMGSMTAPYPFLNYATPAGWFGWMPETAGYTTLGIGVFYAILAMIPLVLLLGLLLLRCAMATGDSPSYKEMNGNKKP